MAGYITKSEAKRAIDEAIELFTSEYNAVYDKIDDLLDAEVVPVVHAKWEWHGPCHDSKGMFWATCSACKTRQRLGDYENYCPKCGAKCDLEDETDDQ